MSAGRFQLSRYRLVLDTAVIRPIRIQPETLTLTVNGVVNTEPVDAVTLNAFAKTSKAVREYGLAPFAARIAWTGAPPAGYDDRGVILLPILDGPLKLAIAIGQLGSYLGVGIVVVGVRGEEQR